MVLSVLHRFSTSGCPFVVLPIRPESDISLSLVHYQNAAGFWWLCCSGFGILCGVMSPIVVSFFLLAIVLSVLVRFSASGCPFGVLTIKPEMF